MGKNIKFDILDILGNDFKRKYSSLNIHPPLSVEVVHLKKETESTQEAREAQRSALSKLAEAQREIKQLRFKLLIIKIILSFFKTSFISKINKNLKILMVLSNKLVTIKSIR